jgi:hypothetical protein
MAQTSFKNTGWLAPFRLHDSQTECHLAMSPQLGLFLTHIALMGSFQQLLLRFEEGDQVRKLTHCHLLLQPSGHDG